MDNVKNKGIINDANVVSNQLYLYKFEELPIRRKWPSV